MNKLLALTSALLLAGATAAPVVAQQYDSGYGNGQSRYDDGDSYRDNSYYGYSWRDEDDDHDEDDEDDDDRDSDRHAVQGRYRDYDEERAHRDHDRDDHRGDRDGRRHGDARWERRHDRRHYAQQRYRATGRYVYPRGYRAGNWNVGSRLPSGYYSRNNYVDYRAYRLSPPPRGYQWVRVNNDVYQVSPGSGLIRDILYGLFY